MPTFNHIPVWSFFLYQLFHSEFDVKSIFPVLNKHIQISTFWKFKKNQINLQH